MSAARAGLDISRARFVLRLAQQWHTYTHPQGAALDASGAREARKSRFLLSAWKFTTLLKYALAAAAAKKLARIITPECVAWYVRVCVYCHNRAEK